MNQSLLEYSRQISVKLFTLHFIFQSLISFIVSFIVDKLFYISLVNTDIHVHTDMHSKI